MALDTREKRANVLSVGRPWMRDKFPLEGADTIDEQWRAASANSGGPNALTPTVGGRIMSSLAGSGGLAGKGGIAGAGGGLAG